MSLRPWIRRATSFALGLAAWRGVAHRGPMAHPVSPPPRGLLDMHCHTAGIGHCGSGAWVSPELRNSWKFPLYLRFFETSLQALRERGDRHVLDQISRRLEQSVYVDEAVILAMDCPYTPAGEPSPSSGELYVSNRWLGETLRDHPRLHFGASIHPARRDALEELHWSKAQGAVLVKWLPNIQMIDPSNPAWDAFYDTLCQLDLPLLTHVGAEDSFSRADDRLGDPLLLRRPLDRGVRVIAAHVASSGSHQGQLNIDRLLGLMDDYPHLVADISTLTQGNRVRHLPKVLRDPRLRDRLLFGTDHPLTNTPLVHPLLYPLRLRFSQIVDLLRTGNPWDRSVKLKAALGVPPEVFTKSRDYLRIPPFQEPLRGDPASGAS